MVECPAPALPQRSRQKKKLYRKRMPVQRRAPSRTLTSPQPSWVTPEKTWLSEQQSSQASLDLEWAGIRVSQFFKCILVCSICAKVNLNSVPCKYKKERQTGVFFWGGKKREKVEAEQVQSAALLSGREFLHLLTGFRQGGDSGSTHQPCGWHNRQFVLLPI